MILIVRCVTQFNPIWPIDASRERDASCFITVMVLSWSRVNCAAWHPHGVSSWLL